MVQAPDYIEALGKGLGETTLQELMSVALTSIPEDLRDKAADRLMDLRRREKIKETKASQAGERQAKAEEAKRQKAAEEEAKRLEQEAAIARENEALASLGGELGAFISRHANGKGLTLPAFTASYDPTTGVVNVTRSIQPAAPRQRASGARITAESPVVIEEMGPKAKNKYSNLQPGMYFPSLAALAELLGLSGDARTNQNVAGRGIHCRLATDADVPVYTPDPPTVMPTEADAI